MNEMYLCPPGIYENLTMDVYLADPCERPSLSSSVACALLDQSPYHAQCAHPRLRPKDAPLTDDSNEASNIGSVAHSLLLEWNEDKLRVIDADSFRSKAARELRDAAIAEGAHPILATRVLDVRRMAAVAREYVARSDIKGVFDAGKPELTLIADVDGVLCRGRPDWLTNDLLQMIHFKTTQGTAAPGAWIQSQLINRGYDVAFAFYQRLAVALGAPRAIECRFLVQEATPPYCCSLVGLSPGMQDLADRKVNLALETWRECLKTNRWPAYSGRTYYAEPKPWHETEFAEREVSGAFDALQAREGVQP